MYKFAAITHAWMAVFIVGLAMLLAAGCADEDPKQPGFAELTATVEPTATPSPTPSPTPEPEVVITIPKNNAKADRGYVPAGPITADPYRVYTGDGDCLNVRPSPGTKFQSSDPRTCVPEGFLLWLYGDPMEVDGLTWRYALGEGWVAEQYVRADPAAQDTLANRVPGFVVSTVDGIEEHFSRVETSGQVTKLVSLPVTGSTRFTQASGSSPAYAATQVWADATNSQAIVFTELETGQQHSVAGARLLGWSDDGKALIILQRSRESLAYVVPGSAPVELGPIPSGMSGWAWVPGGNSVIVAGEGSAVYEFDTSGGGARTVLQRDMSRTYLGELSVSPDGSRIMSSPYLGPLQLITLSSGQLNEFQRAPQQRDVGGRCGGASGKLSVWLDDNTIAWHESYAEKGSNGITIGDLRTGERNLVPFFTLQDISRIDARTLSFTTQEHIQGEIGADGNASAQSFPVVWILDVESGEARPVAIGSTSSRLGV